MSKSPEQRLRDSILQSMGLTEDDVKAMPPEKQQAINDKISDLMQHTEALKHAESARHTQEEQV